MTILVDIDGVIFNSQETLLNLLNTYYGTNYKFEEINNYYWFDEHFVNPWKFLNSSDFWNMVQPNQEAIKYIIKWKQEGHNVKIVTATYYHQAIHAKMKKLKDSFNDTIEDKDIIVCHDKNLVKGDLLIDDFTNNCVNFGNYAILFSQPWNSVKEVEDISNIVRLNNWEKIEDIIRYIEK